MWNEGKCLVTGGAEVEVKVVDNLNRGRLENLAPVLDQIEMVKVDVYGETETEDLSMERSHVIPSLIRKVIRYPSKQELLKRNS